MEGQQLGDYRFGEKLGEGATAAVYRGQRLSDGAGVALKLLHPDLAEHEEVQERFRREARSLGALSHPNIVRFIDFVEEPPYFLFVMELLQGGDLETFLKAKGGRLDQVRAAKWTLQLAEALGAAHAAGVIHRDIKPANVFVTTDGRMILSDFGLAKAEDDNLTRAGTKMIGTPLYMAPEQITGRLASPATDVYQLAVTFYEMLKGTLPFPGENDYDRMICRLELDLKLPAGEIADPLREVFQRAGERDPRRRYPDGAVMAADLRAALAGEPLPFVPPRVDGSFDHGSPDARLMKLDGAITNSPEDESWKDPDQYEGPLIVCPRVGIQFDPGKRPFFVGSDPHVDVYLQSETIAPRQLRIAPGWESWMIETGNFQAETKVNGEQLSSGTRPLPHGAILELGGYQMLWVEGGLDSKPPDTLVRAAEAHSKPPEVPAVPAAKGGGCMGVAVALLSSCALVGMALLRVLS